MPYISDHARRLELDQFMDPEDPGELNYSITRLMLRYLENNGKSYMTLNEIVGALECAKQEFYRRLAVPYEDTKIAENGDVY